MSIPVVTVGQAGEDLVGGLERLHGPITVVRRCSELAELLAACQSGLARAAVVAQGSEELTASLVDRLSAAGVAVVVLTDDPLEVARLEAIRTSAAPSGLDPSSLAARITEAVAALSSSSGPFSQTSASYADPAAALPYPEEPEPEDEERRGEGRIIAVWGPIGAPGRTTVAVNVAAELAADGKNVLLLDADTYGASVATMLGLLDESAGAAQACRLADQGLLDMAALDGIAAPVVVKSFQLRVLTGITRPDRWTELRASALGTVLERCRQAADITVVDVGFGLEADEELSFDTVAPRRNGAALRVLEMADTVFAVGAADSIGVPRLVRGLAELEAAVPGSAPEVLLNKVRVSAVGRSPERQLREAWERFGPATAVRAFLPHDPVAADRALLAGSVLLEVSADSELRTAIARLVCASGHAHGGSAGRLATAKASGSR